MMSWDWRFVGRWLTRSIPLDVETIEALFVVMKSIHAHLDDGRPATAVFRTWLGTWSQRGERFRLVYDPSEAFSSAEYSENGDALEPLLTTTLNDIATFRRKIDVSGIEVNGLPQNKTRRGERAGLS